MSESRAVLAEEVLQFESVAAFSSRLNYNSALEIPHDQLGVIVGKYELPGDELLWATCGLNGCTKRHRFGFLLSNLKGEETNCGHNCGEREFGVKFKEVEAHFERRLTEQARQRVLADLVMQKGDLTRRAVEVLPHAKNAGQTMQRFLRDFQSKAAFWEQLIAVARLGGLIRAADNESSQGGTGRSSVNLITLGRLEGTEVLLSSNTKKHEYVISAIVIPWLQEKLDDSDLHLLDQVALERLSGEAVSAKRSLAEAVEFVANVEKFSQPLNLVQLELVRDKLTPRAGRSDALSRAIRRWAESAHV